MITFDEALNIAKAEDRNVNCCAEYTNYYEFWYSFLGLKDIETEEEYEKQYQNSPLEEGKGTIKIAKKDGSKSYFSLPVDTVFPGEKLIREFEIKE